MNDLEVYVLCGRRTSVIAQRFLKAFAERRSSVAEDFPFPEFSDEPDRTFFDPDELIETLELQANEPYSIYWNVEDGLAGEQAMLFFTEDGGMIAGIGGPTGSAEETLMAVRSVVDGTDGYVTSGSSPPLTTDEFKQLCEQSTLAHLRNGEFRPAGSHRKM